MGSHIGVEAFKPADDKWQRMAAVWKACTEAKVQIPDEVFNYFGEQPPDPAGVEIPRGELIGSGAAREYQGDMIEGYEIDVSKLPKDVTIVRVYVSY